MPHVAKRSENFGHGCLLQIIGVGVAFSGLLLHVLGAVITLPLGLLIAWYGSTRATWYECSDCSTRVKRRDVRVCPGCRQPFIAKPPSTVNPPPPALPTAACPACSRPTPLTPGVSFQSCRHCGHTWATG